MGGLLLLIDEFDDVLSFDQLHVLDFVSDLLEDLLRVMTLRFDFLYRNHLHCYRFLRCLMDALVDSPVSTVTQHFILVDHIIIHDLVWLLLSLSTT